MKGFLDKTWAKAAAFVLTLVFGVLTVLGGVGVGILISYDVFLDGGDFLRQTMYEGNCVRSIDTADSFLRGTLANAGVLVSDGTYDYSTVENGDVTEEERAQVISDLPRVFAEEFSRDAADCHLTVTVRGNGEVVGTFENFELTDGDKPLYATQETFTYALNTGNTAMVTIAADLLRTEEAPSYSYLLDMWLVEHTTLTVFLTVLFAALALFFFCFLMASAGHWAGHEGIHLTWLGKIPADVWLIVLLCTFFIGWEAFYYGWGRVFFCAALVPLVLLFLCAFAAQCKAGTVLRSALIARIVRFLWRIVRSLFLGLRRIARNLCAGWLRLGGRNLCHNEGSGAAGGPVYRPEPADAAEGRRKAGARRLLLPHRHEVPHRRLQALRPGAQRRAVRPGAGGAGADEGRAPEDRAHHQRVPRHQDAADLYRQLCGPAEKGGHPLPRGPGVHRRAGPAEPSAEKADRGSGGGVQSLLRRAECGPTAHGRERAVFTDRGEYQERLAACQLTLVTQPPAPGTVIRADSRLLSRVMDNLVSNICKYALPSTRVYVVSTLSREAVTISFKNVSRDELNISPDELMERFVRGDASRHTEGSGLGLSIARSLVQLQGGRFDLAIDADLFRADITFPLSESAAS